MLFRVNRFLVSLNTFLLLSCSLEKIPEEVDGFYENKLFVNGFAVTEKGYSSISFELAGSDLSQFLTNPNYIELFQPDLEIENGKVHFYVFYDSQSVNKSEMYFPGSRIENTYSVSGDSIAFRLSGSIIVKVASVQHESLCPNGAEIRVSDVKYIHWGSSAKAGCDRNFLDGLVKPSLNYKDSVYSYNTTSKYKLLKHAILIKKITIEDRYLSNDSVQRLVYNFDPVEKMNTTVKNGSWGGLDSIRFYSLESVWKK